MREVTNQQVQRAAQGSHEDIEYIFKAFKSSIEACASKFRTNSFDFEDAVQEGNIGLFRAVVSYSPDKGASFATYAKKCILNGIITAYNSNQSRKHRILTEAKSIDENDYWHDFENEFIRREQNTELIRTAKEQLSRFEFLVFSLYAMRYSNKEIAELTAKDEKSVNNAIQRIRKKLSK